MIAPAAPAYRTSTVYYWPGKVRQPWPDLLVPIRRSSDVLAESETLRVFVFVPVLVAVSRRAVRMKSVVFAVLLAARISSRDEEIVARASSISRGAAISGQCELWIMTSSDDDDVDCCYYCVYRYVTLS